MSQLPNPPASGEVLLARSPFCPPGQVFVSKDGEMAQAIIVGEDVPEEVFDRLKQGIDAHNTFVRAMADWDRIMAASRRRSIPKIIADLGPTGGLA